MPLRAVDGIRLAVPRGQREVGQRLMEEAKWGQALVLYRYYTHSFPQIIVAWNDMGDVYQSLHQKPEAIACYREALRLRPENPRAKDNLEKLRQEMQQREKKIAELENQLKAAKTSVEGTTSLYVTLMLLKPAV